MEQLYDGQIFCFTYNRIKNIKNPNPSFNVKKFCQGRDVAMEITTNAINFKIMAKLDKTFIHNFRLYSIYLIDGEKKSVSMPDRKKHKSHEWLVLSLYINKISHYVNPLNWSVSNSTKT